MLQNPYQMQNIHPEIFEHFKTPTKSHFSSKSKKSKNIFFERFYKDFKDLSKKTLQRFFRSCGGTVTVTVKLPLPHRYLTETSPLPYRYGLSLPLQTVTDRYRPLPTVTDRYHYLYRNLYHYRYFNRDLKLTDT